MPKKTKQINKKQRNAVQNLLADNYTKTPQAVESKKTRAKFACNPKLKEMIERANLIPTDFEFDWGKEISEVGALEAINKWEKILLFELPSETRTYLLANQTFRPEFGESFENYEMTKDKRFVSSPLTLLLMQDLIKVRNFIQNLVELASVFEFANKNNIITSDTPNLLHLLNYRHHNLFKLAKLSAFQKIVEIKGKDYQMLPESLRMGVMIEETATIISEGRLSDFGMTSKEAVNFIVTYFESLIETANLQIQEDTKRLDEQEFTEFLEKTYSDEMNNFIDNVKEISNKVVTTEVIIDGNGNIRFELSPYAEALQGVNISRLRVCDICEKFFWASRKDTFACSKKHSKVRQMRLLRENWKDKGDLYLKARQKKTNKKKEK